MGDSNNFVPFTRVSLQFTSVTVAFSITPAHKIQGRRTRPWTCTVCCTISHNNALRVWRTGPESARILGTVYNPKEERAMMRERKRKSESKEEKPKSRRRGWKKKRSSIIRFKFIKRRRTGLTVSAPDPYVQRFRFETWPGHCVVCSWERHFTLTMPLSTPGV